MRPHPLALPMLLALAATALSVSGAVAEDRPGLAPLYRTGSAAAVANRYIVVLDRQSGRSARAAVQRQADSLGAEVSDVYGAALPGFAASLPPEALEGVRRNPDVAYVEADQRVRAGATQSGSPWALDRIDQRGPPLNGRYRYDETGAGVTAYIIDTGIRKRHLQFGGRVARGFTAIRDGRGTGDCNGHGTHVAGIVGSRRYGVAKGVTLRPVRVLNCRGSGSDSQVIAGIDWVTAQQSAGRPVVANLSLEGPSSVALDDAVQASIAAGVTYTVAAGNDSDDACSYSPADVPAALTVGSSTRSDARSGFSNFGSCVDLFAPGSNITSTWNTSNTATRTLSGTSMAAPQVAGAAALFLQVQPTATPDEVAKAVLAAATTGAVTGRGPGSPNLLLYSRVTHVVG